MTVEVRPRDSQQGREGRRSSLIMHDGSEGRRWGSIEPDGSHSRDDLESVWKGTCVGPPGALPCCRVQTVRSQG